MRFVLLLLVLASISAKADLAADLGVPANSYRLDGLTRAPESRNRATLLHLGRSSKPARMRLLEEAKNYLFITVPYWFDDEEGREFLEAVRKKKRENPAFDFRVLEDWSSPGSNGDYLATKLFRKIKDAAGGEALLWNPWWDFRRWSGKIAKNRVHDKVYVADGEKVIVGGMNIANDYLQGGVTEKGWHDTDLLLEGPIAQQATREFLRPYLLQKYLESPGNPFPRNLKKIHATLQDLFYFEPGDNPDGFLSRMIPMATYLEDYKYFPIVREPADGVPVRLIYDNPLVDGYSKITDTLEFLSQKAKRSLKLYIPYPTLSDRMVGILVAAAKRGVSVEIMVNSLKSSDLGTIDYYGAMVSVRNMVEGGVKVHEWQGHRDLWAFEKAHGCKVDTYWPGHTTHTKVVIADGEVAMVGSHNMNTRSEKMNSEDMALIRDNGIARELEAVWEYDLDRDASDARDLSCGGKTYAGARPPRSLPLAYATIQKLFKKQGLWLKFLHHFQKLM